MKTRKPAIRFKEPKISRERYFSMIGDEFYDLCDKVSLDNVDWARENLRGSEWAIVRGQRIVETGQKQVYPSVYHVRELARRNLAYTVKRPPTEEMPVN